MRLYYLLALLLAVPAATAQPTYLQEGTGVAAGLGYTGGAGATTFSASLVTAGRVHAGASAVTGFGEKSAGNVFGVRLGIVPLHQHSGDPFTLAPAVGVQQVESRVNTYGRVRRFSYTAATVGAEVSGLARVDSRLTVAPALGGSLAFPFRGEGRPASQLAVGGTLGFIFERVAPRLVVEPGLALGLSLGDDGSKAWAVTLALRILPGTRR